MRSTFLMSATLLPAAFALARSSPSTRASSLLTSVRMALRSVRPWANASSASILDRCDSRIAFDMSRLLSLALLLLDKSGSLSRSLMLPLQGWTEEGREAGHDVYKFSGTVAPGETCRRGAPPAVRAGVMMGGPFDNQTRKEQEWRIFWRRSPACSADCGIGPCI